MGLGYVAAEHTVTHPSSGSASDWHCPNCGLPYPTDGTMKCSNCGTALSYNSGSSSGGGGGGGTSTEEIEISSNGLLDPNNPKSIQILGGTIGDLNNLKEFMKTLPVQFVDYLNTLGLKLILKINDYHIDSDGKKCRMELIRIVTILLL